MRVKEAVLENAVRASVERLAAHGVSREWIAANLPELLNAAEGKFEAEVEEGRAYAGTKIGFVKN